MYVMCCSMKCMSNPALLMMLPLLSKLDSHIRISCQLLRYLCFITSTHVTKVTQVPGNILIALMPNPL